MKKIIVEVIITMVNNHRHTMKGYSSDIYFTDDYITHYDVPDSNGGKYNFIVNMRNVLFYEEHRYEVDE